MIDLRDDRTRQAAVAAATRAIAMGSALCADQARTLASRAVDEIAKIDDDPPPPTPLRAA